MEQAKARPLSPRKLLLAAVGAAAAFMVGIAAALIAPLGGTSLPAPEQVVAASAERLNSEGGIEGSYSIETSWQRLELKLDGEFALSPPDAMHITLSALESTTEILFTGEKYYVQMSPHGSGTSWRVRGKDSTPSGWAGSWKGAGSWTTQRWRPGC